MHDIALKDTIAVGDTKSDLCMIKRAGIGIAFNPKDEVLAVSADKVGGNLT